jgi:hypothetical protein
LRYAADLRAVVKPALIFAPRAFLRIAEKVRSAHVVMLTNFSATDAAEVAFGHVRAGFAIAVTFGMIDAAHFVTSIQSIP